MNTTVSILCGVYFLYLLCIFGMNPKSPNKHKNKTKMTNYAVTELKWVPPKCTWIKKKNPRASSGMQWAPFRHDAHSSKVGQRNKGTATGACAMLHRQKSSGLLHAWELEPWHPKPVNMTLTGFICSSYSPHLCWYHKRDSSVLNVCMLAVLHKLCVSSRVNPPFFLRAP